MKDVAERAGVSVTTVSHVLNGTRYVSPKTRRQVRQAIEGLRFYKDAHARGLASGSSDFFGLIVSDITNPFFPEMVRGFETAALERRFHTLLCDTGYNPRRTEAAVQMMIENRVRGVAVMTSELTPNFAEDFMANHVAVVSLDLGTAGPYSANIRVNYTRGIRQAINHLHGLGHRDIGFISGPKRLRSARVRRDAFVSALRSHGLAAELTVEGNHKVDGGMNAARKLLEQDRIPTALLCSNDLTAIGAMEAVRTAGLRVPNDVSVIGFDDIYFSRLTTPPLTTVGLPRHQLGKLAFRALRNILRAKNRRGAEYVVQANLIVRQSTDHPRNSINK